jgi:L-alanine-DL-glutamate epimerase-like enolase superfamily enzyme
LLGLAAPIPTPVSYTIGIGSVEQVREQTRRAAGFDLLKVKLGGPNDREAIRAVRELAPAKRIRVDANEGWPDGETALRMIEWLAGEAAIELVEQPLPAGLPADEHRWLFERSPLPLFADESCHRATDVPRLAANFHGVNVKLMKTGGPVEALRTLRAARERGLKTMLGCMIESSLGIAAAFQLSSLADHLDLDSHWLLSGDPFAGLASGPGMLSFAAAPPPGLGVRPVADQVEWKNCR